MSAVVVIGAQWGDEGKGKVVDIFTQYADAVVRYAGGANAGHTLVVDGKKMVLHLVPSGALHPEKTCVVGPGTVVDPAALLKETKALRSQGLLGPGRLIVSDRAQVVLPIHKLVDGLREESAGDGAIGTTRRGIGPAYEDKSGRRGVRMGDLLHPERLKQKLEENWKAWIPTVNHLGGEAPSIDEALAGLLELGKTLADDIGDTTHFIHETLERGERILLEGAQGTLLDVDHGTYPFVTSSNPISGGACTGAGVGPTQIDSVVGITKAYTTRVGAGPFPTELHGQEGEDLRQAGAEFGATTGRPRRCGWLDAVALRYAVRINGCTSLALTKMDVLTGLKTLRICVAYELDGKRIDSVPADGLEGITPIYEQFEGWTEDLGESRTVDALPKAAQDYIDRIEELVRCPVTLVSVGPGRAQTIAVSDPFGSRD